MKLPKSFEERWLEVYKKEEAKNKSIKFWSANLKIGNKRGLETNSFYKSFGQTIDETVKYLDK